MHTVKHLVLFLSLIMLGHSLNATSPKQIAAKACCFLFGNQDASDEIKTLVKHARDLYDVGASGRLPVKYINKCPWLQQFLAFTWFGTWVNKDAWLKLSQNEKVFAAFHETSHEVLNHPLNQIGVALNILVGSVLLGRLCMRSVKNKLLACGVQTVLSGALLGLIVPWYAKRCEKKADILAAQKLCELGKVDVVKDQITQSNAETDQEVDSSCTWFCTLQKQRDYLQEVINQNTN